MDYQNPKLPEGINVTNEHPLKDFFYLLASVAGVIAIIILVVSFSAGYLAKFIPFETEVNLASKVIATIEHTDAESMDLAEQKRSQQIREYLPPEFKE